MQSRLITNTHETRTFALIFQTGDTVIDTLTRFASENHLDAAHFTAIGAFSDATLAYFDWQSRHYQKLPATGQVEVLSLIGDIADDKGKPKVHAHAVLGKRDGSTLGGHLLEAHVRPTLEVILTQSPAHLRRKTDPASGLALISL